MMGYQMKVINGVSLMTTDIDEKAVLAEVEISDLLNLIKQADKENTIAKLEYMKSIVLVHDDLFAHINMPSTIKLLHDEIVNNFGINRRFLQLRRRILNKRKNAECFIQAMINGVTSYNA